MISRLLRRMFAALSLAGAVSAAHAAIVTLEGCDSCNGASYTLSYSGTALPDADALHETFRVTLSIDTAGAIAAAAMLDAAAIKVSAGAVHDALLVSAPGSAADWRLMHGGLANAGCKGDGKGAGFICADWNASTGLGYVLGGVLEFVFDVTVDNGTLQTGAGAAHVKARMLDSSGKKAGAIVSEDITLGTPDSDAGPLVPLIDVPGDVPADVPSNVPGITAVPEPATALLCALGLGAALSRRRRH
jgi:hypothetical protein